MGKDKIDLLSATGGALTKPLSLTRAADTESFGLSLADVNHIFADANGGQAGNQPLGVNSAAIVDTFGYFNLYVIVNDGTPGFQADTDLVINMATFEQVQEMPPVGVVGVDLFFA